MADGKEFSPEDAHKLRELHERRLNSPMIHRANEFADGMKPVAHDWATKTTPQLESAVQSADKILKGGSNSVADIHNAVKTPNAPVNFDGNLERLQKAKALADAQINKVDNAIKQLKANNPADPRIAELEVTKSRLNNLKSNVSTGLDDAVKARAADLQKQADAFTTKHGLPPVKVKVEDIPSKGGYRNGELTVGQKHILDPKNADGVTGTTFHELTHMEQDALIIRNTNREMTQALGRAPTPDELAAELKNRVKSNYDPDFVKKTVASQPEALTPSDIERARQLETGFRHAKSIQSELNANTDRIEKLREQMGTSNKKIEELHKQNEDLRIKRELANPAEKANIDAQIRKNSTEIGGHEIDASLSKTDIEKLNQRNDKLYNNDYMKIHEVDALYTGDAAGRAFKGQWQHPLDPKAIDDPNYKGPSKASEWSEDPSDPFAKKPTVTPSSSSTVPGTKPDLANIDDPTPPPKKPLSLQPERPRGGTKLNEGERFAKKPEDILEHRTPAQQVRHALQNDREKALELLAKNEQKLKPPQQLPDMPKRPVSELLAEVASAGVDKDLYQNWSSALKGFKVEGVQVLSTGQERLAILLENGQVMKIGAGLSPTHGTRPFDAPILAKGEINGVAYHIQEFAEPMTSGEFQKFASDIHKSTDGRIVLTDDKVNQAGWVQRFITNPDGTKKLIRKPVLFDYSAAE
jgi:cytoplasmic iron level regulating protein YaaA (DUF328/UPF0246 family)